MSCPSMNILIQHTDTYLRSCGIFTEDAIVNHVNNISTIGFRRELDEIMVNILEELLCSMLRKINGDMKVIASCVAYLKNNSLMKAEIRLRVSIMICDIVRDNFWTFEDETVEMLLNLSQSEGSMAWI